jgi:hypothetical protein
VCSPHVTHKMLVAVFEENSQCWQAISLKTRQALLCRIFRRFQLWSISAFKRPLTPLLSRYSYVLGRDGPERPRQVKAPLEILGRLLNLKCLHVRFLSPPIKKMSTIQLFPRVDTYRRTWLHESQRIITLIHKNLSMMCSCVLNTLLIITSSCVKAIFQIT